MGNTVLRTVVLDIIRKQSELSTSIPPPPPLCFLTVDEDEM